MNITGLKGSSLAFVLSQIEDFRGPVLIVTPGLEDAEILAKECSFFCRRPVFVFPPYEVFPFSRLSPHKTTVSRRIETLYKLIYDGPVSIVIAPVESLLQKLVPKKTVADFAEYIVSGENLDRESLKKKLIAGGYEATSLVQEVGDFSIRGGIIDVFPPMYSDPVRIDCFGDWVESIRSFDRLTQRSLKTLQEMTILPVHEVILDGGRSSYALQHIRQYALEKDLHLEGIREIENEIEQKSHFAGSEFFLPIFYTQLDTLRDYLPGDILLVTTSYSEIREREESFRSRIREAALNVKDEPRFSPEPGDLYLMDEQWEAVISPAVHMRLGSFAGEDSPDEPVLHFSILDNAALKTELGILHPQADFLHSVMEMIRSWIDDGESVYLLCDTPDAAHRMEAVLADNDIDSGIKDSNFSFEAKRRPESVNIYVTDMKRGFRFPAYRMVFLTEDELAKGKARRPVSFRKKIAPLLNFSDLKPNDFVVHRDHGISYYRGLVTLAVNNTVNDYLLLEYRDGDKLYLPVYRLNVLQKYIGVEGHDPQVDKLGGKSWHIAKGKVKEAIWQVAHELLDIYARRKVEKGFAFSAPDDSCRDFEKEFQHEETPDQVAAIEETLRDMSMAKPMDRLICGDVGYGKTEVALRAAFKASMDGKQVAVLVPTTVLAEQHYKTFRERFSSFPVKVACLSRFRTPQEQKEILSQLSEGKTDIIIGTHRLLQKDIHFRDVGLLIVDEEHRFGVKAKERLKDIKKTVDVLTLTATPIPRTLQMSLLSVRDLSVMNTPPQDRLPVKTYVTRFEDDVIKEAILREHERGGQAFFVHNRVASISVVAERLQKILPGLKLAVAHGQLSSRALEEVMVRFVRREIDVLVCTTIIESGLDIPSANTIIINRADLLGLAEIHQLRGRVGRSSSQAYAYLLVPPSSYISRDAQKRLEALLDFSELGSGFKLAMSDLQIRGAGNILGTSQTGHIASVGYDLYLDLLEKTVNELKGIPVEEDFEPEINLEISAYIPEEYVPEPEQRLVTYRRLNMAQDIPELEDIRNEMNDRYGPAPPQVEALLSILAVKQDLKRLRIGRLEAKNGFIVLGFNESSNVPPEVILNMMRRDRKRYRFTPEHKLYVSLSEEQKLQPLEEIKKILQALFQNAKVR
ncbi:MAG: transcription-repair coupling factor [Pseudomonadota bacterium]